MIRLLALAFVALGAASAAHAQTSLESKMRQAVGKAMVSLIFTSHAAALADCNASKALLTADTPKFLAAYSESCFAVAARKRAGPGNDELSCPYYLRAIEIWRVSPPPMDNEDAAIDRASLLKVWRTYAAKYCGTPDPTTRTDMGPIAPVAPGSRLETQEGISYRVPDGWTVERFYDDSGSALLKDASGVYFIDVKRSGVKDKDDYSNTETLRSGQVLEWKHYEWLKKSGDHVTRGRVKLPAGYLKLYVTARGLKAGVDKDVSLKLIRVIADSAKIVGKRCIGNCGPGKIVSN
jgi:hypothetical protein